MFISGLQTGLLDTYRVKLRKKTWNIFLHGVICWMLKPAMSYFHFSKNCTYLLQKGWVWGLRWWCVPSKCLARISPITIAWSVRVSAKHGSLIIITRARVTCQGCGHVVIGQHRPPANSSVCKNKATPSNTSGLSVLTKEGYSHEEYNPYPNSGALR